MAASVKESKYKIWLCLVWDDNHYPDWMRRIQQSGVMAAISPLHNSDNWQVDDNMIDDPRVGVPRDLGEFNVERGANAGTAGTPKKPHRHVVMQFSGSQTQKSVNQFCLECIAEKPCLPMRCKNIGGSVRYLVHYSEPDKEHFTISSIVSLNGFDYEKYFQPTIAQEDELFYTIARLIEQEDFNSFYKLLHWLSNTAQNGDYIEEFRYVRSHTHLISSYIRSRAGITQSFKDDQYRRDSLQKLDQIAEVISYGNVTI